MKNVRWILRGLALAGALWAGAAWGGSPDLVISYVTVTNGTTVYPGDTIKIQSGTKNTGTASTGWWYYGDVYYYFGTYTNDLRNNIGSGWTPNANEPNGIDVNEVEDDELSWTIPASTTPGTYYVICKADATGKCSESNENNNLRWLKLTVKGIPSFKNVQWNGLRFVSDGDTAIAYGECVNIPVGATVTINIYEDDVAGDDHVATNLLARVMKDTNNVCYFAKTWSAKWFDDASGDPEYYFTCSYTAYGKTATGNSGETEGSYLHVAKADARMTPSSKKINGQYRGFYYDNDTTTNATYSGPVGDSSGSLQLTDDRIPIILVHGMSGDAKPKTLNYWYGWMNADTNGTLGYFNQSPMKSMFRVYRYVYDSTDYISTNAAKFAQFVNDFYAANPAFSNRQVVVMAHSMGGLVSRYAMNTNPDFAAKVHRLVTLGSPHQGSQGANPTWIKYSGPDDDSWFISGIYNTFKLHNNTAGCFDLAWYATNQIPVEALSESAISAMSDTYQPDLLRKSLKNPFCGWPGMKTTATHDYKMVMFGGSSTNQISDYLSKDWPDEPSGEVKTDHLGLWVATKIFRSMSYANGKGVGDNDGLVPLNSALLTDDSRHPNTTKYNLNATEGQQVDHASYLDVPVTMDSVKAILLTQVRTYCRTTNGADLASARWRLVEPKADSSGPWQKPGVRLPALTPGVTYKIEFKAVSGFTTPADISFTAKKSTTTAVTGTYVPQGTTVANHAPTGILLSNATVDDGAPAGTLVGTLSATDPDSNESFTYSLVSGEGDTGNAWFEIIGNQLKTKREFDYEEYPAHYCRIQVADHAGATHEEAFTIQINNLPDTPGELAGAGWFDVKWDAVPNATSYRVDVTACGGEATHVLPLEMLGTNEFANGQEWKYILPAGASAPNASSGSIKHAPVYTNYGTTNAHFIVGTNGIGIQTVAFPLDGATTATLVFTNGAWNGSNNAERVTLTASYRLDSGAWTTLGTSQPTKYTDGGEVRFAQSLSSPAGATVEFKIEALNACTSNKYLRGGYVTGASVTLAGASVGNYVDGCRVAGFPKTTTETSMRVEGLPVGVQYWHRVEALVNGQWTPVCAGSATSTDAPLATPENLFASDVDSDALLLEWDPVDGAAGYVVQATDLIAPGSPEVVSTCPNVHLAGSENDTGWTYAADHVPVTSNWFNLDANSRFADYHILVVKPNPGVQSPVLDLSGYSEASVSFVMRKRGSRDTGTVWLYWSPDGGATWNEGDSVSVTNTAIYNYQILTIALPPAALVSNAVIELCATNATASHTGTSGTGSGSGVGIRNLSLSGITRGGPDFEASNAIEELADEGEFFLLEDLTPETTYYFRVQAVDNALNGSAWSTNNSATTLAPPPNHAPYGLDFYADDMDESQPIGTLVGLMEAQDDDNDDLTYELVSGDGDTDNASFTIVGDELLLAEVLKVEQGPTRYIRIRASDPSGASVEGTFPINVVSVKKDDLPSIIPTLSLVPGGNGYRMEWEPVDGISQYAVFVSTNLMDEQPFVYFTNIVTDAFATNVLFNDTNAVSGAVKFWMIQPVSGEE